VAINVICNVTEEHVKLLIKMHHVAKYVIVKEKIAIIFALSFATKVNNVNIFHAKLRF
jgi:hypothetical protein